jgi:hypothetical protein
MVRFSTQSKNFAHRCLINAAILSDSFKLSWRELLSLLCDRRVDFVRRFRTEGYFTAMIALIDGEIRDSYFASVLELNSVVDPLRP